MKLSLANWRGAARPAVSNLLNGAVSLGGRAVWGVWHWLSPPARRRVLRPYTRPLGALRGAPLIVVLLLFCFIWGAAFAVLAPFLVLPLLVPPVLLGLIVLWALPETDKPPIRALEWLFNGFFLALVLWPSYLAPAIPGIPRLSLQRLLGFPLAIVVLICVSMSVSFRKRVAEVLRGGSWFTRLLMAFLAIQLLSVFLSTSRGSSLDLYLNVLAGWIAVFFGCCYLMSSPGKPTRFAAMVCLTALVLCVLGIWEFFLHRLPWAGHIPGFLRIDDPVVQKIMEGHTRAGKGHRVQGPFHTSLALSEYLALCTPFLLYFASERFQRPVRIGAAALIPIVIATTVLTQARTGLLGILVALLLFPLLRIAVFWIRNHRSMWAAFLIFGSPLGAVAGLAAALLVPAIRIRLLGGGVERVSNQGRTEQLHLGIPKVLSHPWGYGLGQGAITVGYQAGDGQYTIDSYPLRLAVEYGVVGLVLYYLMSFAAAHAAARTVMTREDHGREFMLLVPLTITIVSYAAMQLNFALDDNQSMIFISYALIMSLIYIYRPYALRRG